MPPRDQLTEARRWVKFPATVLLATGVLWLLQSYFELDWSNIGRLTRTGIGAVAVFTDMVFIPLGTVIVGVGLLFVQRWALYTGMVLPLLPLLMLTADKWQRISDKFSLFHQSGNVGSFGAGVMTSLMLLALWAVYVLMIFYLAKSLRYLQRLRQWVRGRQAEPAGEKAAGDTPPDVADAALDEDELCLLLPDPQVEEEP
jgi:hypothetical protein